MYIFWVILGVAFLFFDFKKPSKYNLAFASTFMFNSIIAYKFQNNFHYQIFGLMLFFGIFLYLIDTIFKKEENDIKKNKNLKDYIGKTAIVKKDIGKTLSIDGLGSIELDNKLWSAKSIDDKLIKAGSEVEIVSKENLIMNVKVK